MAGVWVTLSLWLQAAARPAFTEERRARAQPAPPPRAQSAPLRAGIKLCQTQRGPANLPRFPVAPPARISLSLPAQRGQGLKCSSLLFGSRIGAEPGRCRAAASGQGDPSSSASAAAWQGLVGFMPCVSSPGRWLQACRLPLSSKSPQVALQGGSEGKGQFPVPSEPRRLSVALPVESHRRVSSVLLQAPRWRLWWIWFCFPCAHVAFATTTATLSPQTAPSLPSGGGQISEEVQAGSPPPWLRGKAQYALSAPLEILFFFDSPLGT